MTQAPHALTYAGYDFDKNDPATYYYARQAMHHLLYTIANSKSMNGAMPGSHVKDGLRISTLLMRVVTAVFALLIILEIYKILQTYVHLHDKPRQPKQ